MSFESGYYPPGAEFDSSAPYNYVEPDKKEFGVTIYQTLKKNTSVLTSDYAFDGIDEDRCVCYDTSDTKWEEAYAETHYSPLELIEEFKKYLEKDIESVPDRKKWWYKELIKECSNWSIEETEVMGD